MKTRKSRYSAEETAQRGDALYEREIREQVESAHRGKVVAIDIDRGDYVVADNALAASERLLARHPDAGLGIRCHPLEGPCQLPTPLPSGICFVSGRSGSGKYELVAGVAHPWSRVFGTEIRTSHPSGSRCWSWEPAPAPLARFCAPRKSSVPGRVQGLRTAVVSYPEERGASTSWLAT
jgi:hypothetical protein